jgi:hypothetical protein
MNVQDHGTMTKALPDNVIAFPGTHRMRPSILPPEFARAGNLRCAAPRPNTRPNTPANTRAAAMAGAALNARLLMLLGICTTSLVVVLSAVHVLHG